MGVAFDTLNLSESFPASIGQGDTFLMQGSVYIVNFVEDNIFLLSNLQNGNRWGKSGSLSFIYDALRQNVAIKVEVTATINRK